MGLAYYKVQHPTENLSFLVGEYPGSAYLREQEGKLEELLNKDVRAILNLMEESEMAYFFSYQSYFGEQLKSKGHNFTFKHLSIRDLDVPTAEQMVTILNQIDEWLAAGLNPYVHCWGGHGRSGTVVGCWLVRHGIPAKQALQLIQEWRANSPFRDSEQPSPQTQHQIDMVRNWQESSPLSI